MTSLAGEEPLLPAIGGSYPLVSASSHVPYALRCKFATLLQSAMESPKSVLTKGLKVLKQDANFLMVTSASLTGHWPDLPLTYAKGDFDIARRGSVRIDGEQLPRMAPLTEDTAKEYDGEFAWLCDCLIKNKVPATKITLDDRTLGRGRYHWCVVSAGAHILAHQSKASNMRCGGADGVAVGSLASGT